MTMLMHLVGLFLSLCFAKSINMNGEYVIANPDPASKVQWSTEMTDEYFDVYSPPIQSRYAEVFWTMMDHVPIPDDVRKRFANKTMLVTGYESDQVQRTPKGDVSWPITHAYNHHFEAWLYGAKSELIKLNYPSADPKSLASN